MGNSSCCNFRRSVSPTESFSKVHVVPQNSQVFHPHIILRSHVSKSEVGFNNSKKKNLQMAKSFYTKFEDMTEKDFIDSYFPIYGVLIYKVNNPLLFQ